MMLGMSEPVSFWNGSIQSGPAMIQRCPVTYRFESGIGGLRPDRRLRGVHGFEQGRKVARATGILNRRGKLGDLPGADAARGARQRMHEAPRVGLANRVRQASRDASGLDREELQNLGGERLVAHRLPVEMVEI